MPTVTVEESVSLQEIARVLQEKLGADYEVTTRGTGSKEALKVSQAATSIATVQLCRDGNATTCRVQGGGLIISRMVNQLVLAKKVAGTIKETLGLPAQASPGSDPG